MFKTFRHRLLFWFLVFISFGLIVITLSLLYLDKREAILKATNTLEKSYAIFLKTVKSQQDFFSYDTKNQDYFISGKSNYLSTYQGDKDSTLVLLNSINFNNSALDTNVDEMTSSILTIDSLFTGLTKKVKERGYKDYNLVGSMRDDVHWLEANSGLPAAQILTLRRHEKDYIIRNEATYINRHKTKTETLRSQIQQMRLSKSRRDSLLYYLNNYETKFKAIVALDAEIGIKDNTGLKAELDYQINALETGFNAAFLNAKAWSKEQFVALTKNFMIIGLILFILSILLSTIISKRITKPLTELTIHITKFVDSNFTLETEHPVVRSKDEIGSLTKNFSFLKDEVISRLKFFKQKVDERTKDLADANTRLLKLSEANSRFVPKEFLNNLNKKSIEEVRIGDHVQREMTVMFTDIREFTKISETLTPQENFDFINTYLSGVVPIIEKHGGFIDKFIGDSVMALFPDDPDAAIKATTEFEDFLVVFNKQLEEKNQSPIHIGTGIHTGQLILGTIGHDNRLETTVISDAVNTASRVEGLTKYYDAKIICTESTLKKLKGKFKYRFLDNVKVKGKSKTIAVYEFLCSGDVDKLETLDQFNEGIKLIREKKISEASKIYGILHEKHPNDKAVEIFYKKCQDFLQNKKTEWDTITQMIVK